MNSVANILRKVVDPKEKKVTLQRAQKRFDVKCRSPESTVVESSRTSQTDKNPNANEKQDESTVASIDSRSESGLGLEPKSSDFPTVMPSKSRSSAGQDDDLNNHMSPMIRKQRTGWDDVEMLHHGLINCYCVRAALPESTNPSTTINTGNTYNRKMTTLKSSNHHTTSIKSESVQSAHSDHSNDIHKSI
ncbi:unnamed protein product [Litomosoides sigmodontis]|uniref:Uncharacterized protein n=1 Tax=Litomosoides sigmodontis TaxID=42156 RepID=A0A3P6TXV7_LITSI|nr:unnamed protein product [Litomosoides sigmodontis]